MIKKILIPNPDFIDDVASLRVAFIDSNADVLEYSTTFEIQKVVPISNICFPAGTPIETDQGIIEIDKINVEKNTINNKKIVAITETVSLDSDLVFFPTNSLGPNIPSQPTAISNNHLVQNPSTNEMIKAKDYLEINNLISKIPYKKEFLYNILMETHDIINVNNLQCETLYPWSMVALLYQKLSTIETEEEKHIWIKSFNSF
jgi:hypothetical protein